MRAVVAAVILILGGAAAGQEWTGWRGGVGAASVKSPVSWPESFSTVWRLPLGEGYSSPVASRGLVFVHSRNAEDEVVTAADLNTGKVRWEYRYPAPYEKNQYATRMMKGPNSTPLIADGRLFTLGATGILTAWGLADGKLLWRNDYSDIFTTSRLFCGTAASPILHSGSVIIHVGSDQHGGKILALDPATGKERWTWSGEGPGYSTPTVVTFDGIHQIITLTNSRVIGIDASNGKDLWSIPFRDEWHENIVTPVWTGQQLVVSGTRLGTRAYNLHTNDGEWRAQRSWHSTEIPMYMSSPVLADGILYGFSNKKRGHLFALDVRSRTPTIKWTTEGREGDHASLLFAGENLLCLSSAGLLRVAEVTPKGYAEVRRYQVSDSETWASPILLPDGIIVRDREGLARIRLHSSKPSSQIRRVNSRRRKAKSIFID